MKSPGLEITMPYLISTAGMLNPMESLIELLPAGLRNYVSYPSSMENSFDPGEKSCKNTNIYHSREVPIQIFHWELR